MNLRNIIIMCYAKVASEINTIGTNCFRKYNASDEIASEQILSETKLRRNKLHRKLWLRRKYYMNESWIQYKCNIKYIAETFIESDIA